MTAVMISIRPEWCKKIAQGEKTIEARKTKPKIETPFKCYIYCTKGQTLYRSKYSSSLSLTDEPIKNTLTPPMLYNGKIIGEFICDKIVWVVAHPAIFAGHDLLYSKAIEMACLTQNQAEKYANGKDVYGWSISQLQIYEEPLALNKFSITKTMRSNGGEMKTFTNWLQNSPQSWCYVDEVKT